MYISVRENPKFDFRIRELKKTLGTLNFTYHQRMHNSSDIIWTHSNGLKITYYGSDSNYYTLEFSTSFQCGNNKAAKFRYDRKSPSLSIIKRQLTSVRNKAIEILSTYEDL